MLEGVDELENFFDNFNKGLNKLDKKQVLVNGQVVDSDLRMNENRLSPNEDEAIKEASYLEKRKGGTFSEKDNDAVDRLVRDVINDSFKEIER